MATNYVQEGEIVQYTNGGSDIAAGDVVVMGNVLGVALVDIAGGATGSVAVEGVFICPKVTGNAWTVGAKLSWDVSATAFDLGTATAAAGDITGAAFAFLAAGSSDTTGQVHLDARVGAITAGS
jgi:predicted RecA/RadA family phage recombinase